MRQRCEHGYVIDPEDRCPECERDALRKDNERLRAALREIAKYEIEDGCPCNACQHSSIARAALGGGGEVMPVVSHDYIDKHREVVAALVRAQTILENMAMENVNPWRRWPIHHEPLRADAKALLPVIRAALGEKP